MKLLTILLLVISFTFNSDEVKKGRLAYGVIVGKADLIVHGRIYKNLKEKKQYHFKISDAVKGKSEEIITVNCFQIWTCDRRIKPIKFGQELLLFLTKNDKGEYDIIHGSTGELFISKDQTVSTYGNKDFPNIEIIKKGIKSFNKSFQYFGELYGEKSGVYFERKTSIVDISKLSKENIFFKMAYESISNFQFK